MKLWLHHNHKVQSPISIHTSRSKARHHIRDAELFQFVKKKYTMLNSCKQQKDNRPTQIRGHLELLPLTELKLRNLARPNMHTADIES